MSKRKTYYPKPIRVPTLVRTAYVFSEVERILRQIETGYVDEDIEGVIVARHSYYGFDYDVCPTLAYLRESLDRINASLGWHLPTAPFEALADELGTGDAVSETTISQCKAALITWQAHASQIPSGVLDTVARDQKIKIELQRMTR